MDSERVVIVVQARLKSQRLPRKVLLDVCGRTVLQRVVDRCRAVPGVGVVIACPYNQGVDIRLAAPDTLVVEGDGHNLLERIISAGTFAKAKTIVRVTADEPLICPVLIAEALAAFRDTGTDIMSTWFPGWWPWPNGMDLEIYSLGWLKAQVVPHEYREYFAQWLLENLDVKNRVYCPPKPIDPNRYRLTVDYPEDLKLVQAVYTAMDAAPWTVYDIYAWLDEHPEVGNLNRMYAEETGSREENEAREL